MKKTIIASSTKTYIQPSITRIGLDNEISLVLASDVDPMGEPTNPGWSQNDIKSDPFKTGIA